jgi:3-hydroxymyristoyl/3-hydroxydecanoyl-(acyl carrier protein) dehydratase
MLQESKAQAYPFDFIDRLLKRDGNSCQALKRVTHNEWALTRNTAGEAWLAWPVLVELMAQTAGRQEEYRGGFQYQVVLTRLLKVCWQRPVTPGETLVVHARLLKAMGFQAAYHVQVSSAQEVLAEGDFYFEQTEDGTNQRI